jgi:hypothetical protein
MKSPLNFYISSICDQSGRGKQTSTPYVMKRTPFRMQPGSCRSTDFRIRAARRLIKFTVNPLRFLVDAFVNTFGITQPTPETEVKAGRFIAIMLAAVLVLLGAVAWMLRTAFTH